MKARDVMSPECYHAHSFQQKLPYLDPVSSTKKAVLAIYRSRHRTGCPVATRPPSLRTVHNFRTDKVFRPRAFRAPTYQRGRVPNACQDLA